MHISSATMSIREHLHERFKDSFGNTSNDISTRLRRRWRGGGALQAGGAPEPEIAETGDEFKVAEYHLETKHDDDNGFVFSIGHPQKLSFIGLISINFNFREVFLSRIYYIRIKRGGFYPVSGYLFWFGVIFPHFRRIHPTLHRRPSRKTRRSML